MKTTIQCIILAAITYILFGVKPFLIIGWIIQDYWPIFAVYGSVLALVLIIHFINYDKARKMRHNRRY